MQLILDHLSTIIVISMVALSLTISQVRMSMNRVEQVAAYDAKNKALSLGQWIESDIVTLGKNLGQDNYRFEYPTYDAYGNTTEWVFWSDSTLSSANTTRYYTRFALTQVDSIAVEDSMSVTGAPVYRPLFQARRFTAAEPVTGGAVSYPDPADWSADGLTVQTLSAFTVELLMQDGSLATFAERDEADYIRISFAMLPEIDPDQAFLSELFWSTTLKVRPFWEQYETTAS